MITMIIGHGENPIDISYISIGRYKFRSEKDYYRTLIPITKIASIKKLPIGSKVILKLYIKGVGVIDKKTSAKGKYLNIYISRRANYNIKDGEVYEIYLIEIEKLSSIDRNIIIYSNGRKARIEIPKWYLKDRGIASKSIIKVDAEIMGRKKILFTKYPGEGPAIQSIPSMEKYPRKIKVTDITRYNISKFIEDFNRLTEEDEKYKNIKLKLKEKLYLTIDGEDIKIGEFILSTYAHYTYLTIRIYGEDGFKTLRINNYGDRIKIYYIQHTNKQKLTQHAAHLPLEKIIYKNNKLTIKYYNPRRRKISETKITYKHK